MHLSNEFSVIARRLCRFAFVLVAAAIAGSASARDLPALLANATAGSGWNSACPGRNEHERAMISRSKLALSPDLSERLDRQFPIGSPESALKNELAADGFAAPESCEADPSIMRARFFQKGAGFLRYDVDASVYWKTDGNGKLVWTAGFIFYGGL